MWASSVLVFAAATQIAIILAWLWQHVEINRIKKQGLWIAPRASKRSLPPITVVIPARNESARIEACLRSVLSQGYPELAILVVDDRSTDDTGKIVLEIAGEDERVAILRIDALPGGWGGKSYALWEGAQTVQTPWILFLDADCRILPRGLASAVEYALDVESDLLSLWPRDGSTGFWERLLVPLCGAMIVIWYGRSGGGGRTAFANGQFLLVRRDSYFAIGGHAAVRDALVEDIPLARLAQDSGFRVRSAVGSDVCEVRMYAGLREVISGWQRIYLGVLTPLQIGLCAVSILLGSIPPYVVLPILLSRRHTIAHPWLTLFIVLGVIHFVALMATSVRFFSIARCRIRYLWLYPFSCVGVLFILASALVRSVGRTTIRWRGTTYAVRGPKIRV